MYSEENIQSAVKAGAIEQSAADALRAFVTSQNSAAYSSEENFRLVSGFNDIFVTIATIIMLFAMWWIGNSLQADLHNYSGTGKISDAVDYGRYKAVGPFFCACTAWCLAEYFTRIRRTALPSIVLLLALVIGVYFGIDFFLSDLDYSRFGWVRSWMDGPGHEARRNAQTIRDNANYAIAGFFTALAALLFWIRMRAPIAIAAATGMAALATLFSIFYIAEMSDLWTPLPLTLTLGSGIAIFGYAMWWDMSDTSRTTQRSDIAFWLHMLAAPMIAHALFGLIGVSDGDRISTAAVILVVGLYAFFAIVAIAVDRRALLVSALAYVLIAMTALFRNFGVIELGVALTALIIGSALLLLSAFWVPIRQKILGVVPSQIKHRLPAAN
jgi:hypothetical protein